MARWERRKPGPTCSLNSQCQRHLLATASNTTAINNAATGSHPLDTFTYQVSDGNGGVTTETLSFAINRPPVVSAASSVTYHFSNPATTLSSALTDSDPDGDHITGATVQITGGTFTSDGDQLTATRDRHHPRGGL